jgi:hypothetical protein
MGRMMLVAKSRIVVVTTGNRLLKPSDRPFASIALAGKPDPFAGLPSYMVVDAQQL